MKFLSVLTFAATAASVVLPAERRQSDDDDSIENYTFLQFPETGATCRVFDFSEKFFPSEQLKEWAYGERFTNPYDESAANVASGRCVSLRGFPFFWVRAISPPNYTLSRRQANSAYLFIKELRLGHLRLWLGT